MHTAEIVVSEVQRDSRFKMRQFFTESIRESGKSAHRHSHRQVLPLHERRRDMLRIRIASSDLGYNPRDAWWGVPRIGSIELPVIAEQFHKLREVRVQTKTHRHSALVMMQTVSSDLSPAFDAVVQVPHKFGGITAQSLPDVERRNEFSFRVNGDKNPLAANSSGSPERTRFCFLPTQVQISSISRYLGRRPRILVFMSFALRSPATMSSRMMVLRFRPVSRSVDRIEQPSSRQCSARSAASGFDRNVSRVSLVWGSENRVLQEVHFQR